MKFTLISTTTGSHPVFNNEIIANFLLEQLEEYGDEKQDILNALDYAANIKTDGKGYVLIGHDVEEIIGVVVINETGMSGYIPENILVYIATHKNYRGKGYGRELMVQAIDQCKGDIALHVEKENPARFLYEKLGFTNPYIEMRLKR